MLKDLKKKTEGFTIIEVMIVLVIAAVIILIVFLAVPALQRNSRNNQRKNDVARVSAAITEYANNNDGDLPSAYTDVDDEYVGSLGYYTTATIQTSAPAASAITEEALFIVTGATCDGNTVDASSGTDRQFAMVYAVETGQGDDDQCTEG